MYLNVVQLNCAHLNYTEGQGQLIESMSMRVIPRIDCGRENQTRLDNVACSISF